MTIPEVNRTIKAWGWREDRVRKQQEQFVYILPTLISALFAKEGYPKIYDVFSKDFEELREADAEKEQQATVARFLQFANNFNKQFSQGVNNNE